MPDWTKIQTILSIWNALRWWHSQWCGKYTHMTMSDLAKRSSEEVKAVKSCQRSVCRTELLLTKFWMMIPMKIKSRIRCIEAEPHFVQPENVRVVAANKNHVWNQHKRAQETRKSDPPSKLFQQFEETQSNTKKTKQVQHVRECLQNNRPYCGSRTSEHDEISRSDECEIQQVVECSNRIRDCKNLKTHKLPPTQISIIVGKLWE